MNNSLVEIPYVGDVKPLGETDQPFIEELAELLERYGFLNRFGLTLLHQHFSLEEDEVMLERTDEERRFQTNEVVRLDSLPEGDVLQTAWRFGKSGDPAVMWTCTSACARFPTGGDHTNVHIESK